MGWHLTFNICSEKVMQHSLQCWSWPTTESDHSGTSVEDTKPLALGNVTLWRPSNSVQRSKQPRKHSGCFVVSRLAANERLWEN